MFDHGFFPFGRLAYMPELLPTLRYLRKKNTRIMASIGYPLLLELERLKENNLPLASLLICFFDNFLIHTPTELENPYIQNTIHRNAFTSLRRHHERSKKRIIYTGYVYPEK